MGIAVSPNQLDSRIHEFSASPAKCSSMANGSTPFPAKLSLPTIPLPAKSWRRSPKATRRYRRRR